MNIFVTSLDPITAARNLCDKHVVKMVLETAQLLSGAHRFLDGDDADPRLYKLTHTYHPCAVWVRAAMPNYHWTLQHFHALLNEYQYRYNKEHACGRLLGALSKYPAAMLAAGVTERTPFPQCMPDRFHHDDATIAYQRYYEHKWTEIDMRWTRRPAPQWLLCRENAA